MEPRENQINRRTIVIGSFVTIAIVCLLAAVAIQIIGKKLDGAQKDAEHRRAIRWIHNLAGSDRLAIDSSQIVAVVAPHRLGTVRPATLYKPTLKRGFSKALRWIAEDGYNGPIELAAAIDVDGSILELQVLNQNETQGFGDIIQGPNQPWILAFRGRSLDNPSRDQWLLSDNGGAIDGLSGATITANAIVHGVSKALEFLSDVDRSQP